MGLATMHRPIATYFVATCALLMGASGVFANTIQSFEQSRAAWQASDTRVLDRHGALLQRTRTDLSERRGDWVALADLSPALRQAIVLSEDRRFYEHSGVDWQAVSSAAFGALWHGRTRGASTLTMQLAGLLDDDLRAAPGGRSVGQKLGQAWAATQLERTWRKDQILEAYLNRVPFRGEIVGIDALSRSLFGQAPWALGAREAAVAAALVRAPNAGAAAVTQRACGVLQRLPQPQACDGLDLVVAASLKRRLWRPHEGIAPHAARRVIREASAASPAAANLPTTLDAAIQRTALAALHRHLAELRGSRADDGAVLVLDNASGQVRAWVGSSGALSAAPEVDAVLALRQAGSTLKPFVYGLAIEQRRITAASWLLDEPTALPTGNGLYAPQNYDRSFKGWVTARTALASSLNVPAVRVAALVSPQALAQRLSALGLPLAHDGEHYGLSLALGSADVTLLSLTNAYRTLANGGRHSAVAPLLQGAAPPALHAAMPAGAAFIVGDILADPNARARTFGTDSVLATRFWTAVKTGTSKDLRDNWAVGYSSRYTVGVWVGHAAGASMRQISGVHGAAPIWAEVMQALHAGAAPPAPKPPAGVVAQQVQFSAPAPQRAEAPRQEWFLPSTEQARWALADTDSFAMVSIAASAVNTPQAAHKALSSSADASAPTARIALPVPGTVVALDPDIPSAAQRLRLVADVAPGGPAAERGQALQWRLNGKPLPGPKQRGAQIDWPPLPGRHALSLHDAQGRQLDVVALEVRGLRAAAPPR